MYEQTTIRLFKNLKVFITKNCTVSIAPKCQIDKQSYTDSKNQKNVFCVDSLLNYLHIVE